MLCFIYVNKECTTQPSESNIIMSTVHKNTRTLNINTILSHPNIIRLSKQFPITQEQVTCHWASYTKMNVVPFDSLKLKSNDKEMILSYLLRENIDIHEIDVGIVDDISKHIYAVDILAYNRNTKSCMGIWLSVTDESYQDTIQNKTLVHALSTIHQIQEICKTTYNFNLEMIIIQVSADELHIHSIV